MNLKNICMATSIMAAVGILNGCGSVTSVEDLHNYGSYNTLITKPTLENLETLLSYIKDKNDLESLMDAFQLSWNLVRKQDATVQKQKELQALYDTGKNWVSNVGLDARELSIWLHIENEADARNIIVSPTSPAIINSALKLTNSKFNDLLSQNNLDAGSVRIRQIVSIKTEYDTACNISKIYPELKPTIEIMTNTVKSLAVAKNLQYHRECARYCSNEETDPNLYKQHYLAPLENSTCSP